jgi:hypothetical protein
MALLNGGFEDAGALPGEAAHWTLTASTSLEAIAGFGAAPEEAWEGFERWFPWLSDLADVVVVRAFFDGALSGFEDLEEGWANDIYLRELPFGQLVTCPFGGGAVEDGETGWNNAPFALDWEDVLAEAGQFDGEPREDFDDQWRSNESYARTWGEVVSAPALFTAGVRPVEDFENAWLP